MVPNLRPNSLCIEKNTRVAVSYITVTFIHVQLQHITCYFIPCSPTFTWLLLSCIVISYSTGSYYREMYYHIGTLFRVATSNHCLLFPYMWNISLPLLSYKAAQYHCTFHPPNRQNNYICHIIDSLILFCYIISQPLSYIKLSSVGTSYHCLFYHV